MNTKTLVNRNNFSNSNSSTLNEFNLKHGGPLFIDIANIKNEFESDCYTTCNKGKIVEVLIKEEPHGITDDVEDDMQKVYDTIGHKNVVEMITDDNKVTIQETIIHVNSLKSESQDTLKCMYVNVSTSIPHFYCENCGVEYENYCTKCPMLARILHNSVSSTATIDDRAKRTIPRRVLEIRESLGRPGVFALHTLPKGVIFGPFHGLISTKGTTGRTWRLENGRLVSNQDGNGSNWMQYVHSVENVSRKNVVAFQHDGRLFYRSDREIGKGEELLVRFSEIAQSGAVGTYRPVTENKMENVYACTFCCFAFTSAIHLATHKTKCPLTTDEGASPETVRCQFCGIYLFAREYSEYHVKYCCDSNVSGRTAEAENETACFKGRRDEDKKFGCTSCAFRTKHRFALKRHALVHEAVRPFTCPICRKGFTQKASLKSHALVVHAGEKPFACPHCDFKYGHKADLATHVRNVHRVVPERHRCARCPYETDRAEDLRRHANGHERECKICGRSFAKTRYLREHVVSHTGERPYGCPHCEYRSSYRRNLALHVKTAHRSSREYRCALCGYETNNKCHYKRHLNGHDGVRPYACKICGRSFAEKGNLKRHVRVHTGEKPYSCRRCEFRCLQKGTLAMHRRDVHPSASANEENAALFKCEVCEKCFSNGSCLKRHAFTHTGEKLFACDLCDYKCNYKNYLRVHVTGKHGGPSDKKYKCGECAFESHYTSALRRHVTNRHRCAVDKKYQCGKCPFKTNHKSSLARHVLAHGPRSQRPPPHPSSTQSLI